MQRSAPSDPSSLPHSATPLFGREEVVRQVVAAIADDAARLLTLTGPGGIGKTRVAVEAASRLATGFPDGVCFVDLSGVVDAELAPTAVLGAMGLRGLTTIPALHSLVMAVGDRRMLLVLDNLEQVIGFAAGVAELLSRCPSLGVVATSRIPLRVRAERQLLLAPLEEAAVELFADRAGAVDAAFRLTSESRPVVVEICRRLDGLPLAIELAAARASVLSPPALLARLTDRLTPLGGGPRDLPDRQRTLRDAIAWSEELLAPGDRRAFRRLALFSGPFTAEEADAVAPGSGEDVETLVEHSLLRRGRDADETTFSMLETIRAFGRERLAEGPDAAPASAAHAALLARVAEQADTGLVGPDQRRWLRRLDRLQDDGRAVLTAAFDGGDAALGLRLATHLWRYWETRGRLAEGKRWLARAVAAAEDFGTPELARALNHLGNLELDLGELPAAGEHYRAALAIREAAGDPARVADTLNNLGLVALAEARLDDASALHERSLAIRRAVGDRPGEALSLGNLGDVAAAANRPAHAVALHGEALAINEGLGDERRIGYALANLAEAHLLGGHPEDVAAAEPLLARAGALFDVLDEPGGQALVRFHLGALRGNDGATALGHVQSSLRLRHAHGQALGVVDCLQRIGEIGGDARLLSAADAIRQARGWPRTPAAASAWKAAVRGARASGTPGASAAAWDAGAALSLEAAVEVALAATAGYDGPSSTDQDRPAGLSAREVEVLRLVAAGLTNAEIGARLFLSHTTINAHLRRIYPKIGVDNRAAASTFAASAGLVDTAPPASGG